MDPNVIKLAMGAGGAESVGNLYAWGLNTSGQIGDSTRVSKSSPISVGALANWSKIGCGFFHSIAIKTDGTLWTWGSNNYGQLGSGTQLSRSSPVQVGSSTDWSSISTISGVATFAIKTDGTLWACGRNDYQRPVLGLNDVNNRSSLTQVGSLTNWSFVCSSQYHTTAIKTDGTLWSWGGNQHGQVGDDTTTSRSSPVQVGSLTNWDFAANGLSHTLAIKTNGTLWAWGRNQYGQLGLNDTTNRSSPVQVGSSTDWASVSASRYASAAIKTNGTLWTTGGGYSGALGSGSTTSRSNFTQVGSLTNWSKVFCSPFRGSVLATKTDGTLWAWGENSNGLLGLGDTTNRSSPVQVGVKTNWLTMALGGHALGKVTP
jgi:alpha-tubulin suppressor-like RCC1 family protein